MAKKPLKLALSIFALVGAAAISNAQTFTIGNYNITISPDTAYAQVPGTYAQTGYQENPTYSTGSAGSYYATTTIEGLARNFYGNGTSEFVGTPKWKLRAYITPITGTVPSGLRIRPRLNYFQSLGVYTDIHAHGAYWNNVGLVLKGNTIADLDPVTLQPLSLANYNSYYVQPIIPLDVTLVSHNFYPTEYNNDQFNPAENTFQLISPRTYAVQIVCSKIPGQNAMQGVSNEFGIPGATSGTWATMRSASETQGGTGNSLNFGHYRVYNNYKIEVPSVEIL